MPFDDAVCDVVEKCVEKVVDALGENLQTKSVKVGWLLSASF